MICSLVLLFLFFVVSRESSKWIFGYLDGELVGFVVVLLGLDVLLFLLFLFNKIMINIK